MKNHETIFDADVHSIILIGEKIIQKHTALGPSSPLKCMLIADLHSRISAARQKHDEGEKYRRLMEDAWRDRDRFLGIKEKNVQYSLQAIASILDGEKCDMRDWGFTDE